jgi:hypothetical protein
MESSTKNINKSATSIIIMIDKKYLVFAVIDFQLDNKAKGIIIVVSNPKYMENPSQPRNKSY